jgi:hypothetical protein
VEHARRKYGVSERQACRVLQQWRGTQRYLPMQRTNEEALTVAMIELVTYRSPLCSSKRRVGKPPLHCDPGFLQLRFDLAAVIPQP